MDDFFKIEHTVSDCSDHTFTISINPEHQVFKGHFPGKPIVPGVMTLMMMRKCVESIVGKPLQISFVKEAKYISPIIPDGRKVIIRFTLDSDLNVLNGEVKSEDGEDFTKVRMTLIPEVA